MGDKAVALDPEDGGTFHFLGRWCWNVAGVSWVERGIASTFFAKPPESTYEEALGYFEKCDKTGDSSILNLLWMGHCLKKLNRKEEAKKTYQKAVDMAYDENNT